ncbi:murein hydrolase activator EnvC family protein [Janibacter sp. G56]|uniref:murein hydrolase activator EnvC family protein n=1 Tax=Janibacter sp. G56 TaxID=3418717 RepID=UPI003D07DCA9
MSTSSFLVWVIALAQAASLAIGTDGTRWAWPLTPTPDVVRRFDAPDGPYGRGHRGVDLSARVAQPVMAVAVGRVTHVGRIAGRWTVSVTHPSGIRSTYEPVTPSVRRGDVVGRGTKLGTISSDPGHCAPATCLHLGARRGRTYLDPLSLFGRRRVVLLPLGSALTQPAFSTSGEGRAG